MSGLLLKLFVKNYQDTEDTKVRTAYGKLSGTVGIICNLILFAAKLLIGTISGSVSITADAVNNLSDASGSIVTLLGFRMASKPADEEHPYGHARIEYFSGLIVAAIILVIGIELGKSSVEKILHPEEIVFSTALFVVLSLSILVKLWMALFNKNLGKRIQSQTLLATSADSRNDVISTGAVLLSCLIGKATGLKVDGYMGLLVALFILYSGIMIAKDTMDPLLGAAPDETLVDKITTDLLANSMVLGVHDMMIHDYGPGRKFASAHAEMDSKTDVMEAHETLDELERECLKRHGVCLTLHYDPIETDNEILNRMKVKVKGIAAKIDPRISTHDFRMVMGKRHLNLIFDMVVPYEFNSRRTELAQKVAEKVQEGEDTTFHTIINFDNDAFNKVKKST